MKQTTISDFLRQRAQPFIVPSDGEVGAFKIENGVELERSVKAKNVRDVAALLSELSSDECWLLYLKPSNGQTLVIAVSERMEASLCSQSS